MLNIRIVLILVVLCSVKADKLDEMSWEPGDILKCRLSGFPGFLGFKHYMIGGDEPGHVITVFNNGAAGRISDVHHRDFVSGINRDKCENIGKGRLSREETMQIAKRWVGRTFTYDVIGCNCQHFTNYWANGYSGKWYNNQSLKGTEAYCPI